MKVTKQIAKHIREVHFGPNWTSVSLKELLDGLSLEKANTRIGSLNTIAMLVFHMNYYINAVLKVLNGGKLDAKDALSYDLPPLQSEKDWEQLKARVYLEAEAFAKLVEELPDTRLWETFIDEKYGNYHRNFLGIVEHCHYHLGQIALLKKMLESAPGK